MKIQILGTAAYERVPALFCGCTTCVYARANGGKNIRTRSQALIDEELLIDLPADTYAHFLQNGIRGDQIRYLLVTHSHSDHLYPKELAMRHAPYAHNMVPELEVYCGEGAFGMLEKCFQEKVGFSVSQLHPFVPTQVGSYRVTALPARHYPGDGALFYIIQGEKNILYAHDTGFFYEEVFEYIRDAGIRFDFATFDCTNVDIPISDEGTHMGIPNILRVVDRLESLGAMDEKTIKVINHFSHNGKNVSYDEFVGIAAEHDFEVSYDGMVIEF